MSLAAQQPKSFPWTQHLRGGLSGGALTLSLYTGVRCFFQSDRSDGAAMALTSGSLLGFASNIEGSGTVQPRALLKHSVGSGLGFLGIYGCVWASNELYRSY